MSGTTGADGAVRVVCAQLDIDGDRPEQMRAAVSAATAEAAALGARIVVLPELANSGYHFTDHAEALSRAEPVPGPWTDLLCGLSDRHGTVIVSGLSERSGKETLYSSSVIVDRGTVLGVHRKAHLWDREELHFTSGNAPTTVVDTSVGRIATAVCYDIEFPEMVRVAAERGAALLAAPVNWPVNPPHDPLWPIEVYKVMAHAADYRIPVAVADRCGHETGGGFTGGTVIVGHDGYPLAGPRIRVPAEPWLAVADVPTGTRSRLTDRNDALDDRRPGLYGSVAPCHSDPATIH